MAPVTTDGAPIAIPLQRDQPDRDPLVTLPGDHLLTPKGIETRQLRRQPQRQRRSSDHKRLAMAPVTTDGATIATPIHQDRPDRDPSVTLTSDHLLTPKESKLCHSRCQPQQQRSPRHHPRLARAPVPTDGNTRGDGRMTECGATVTREQSPWPTAPLPSYSIAWHATGRTVTRFGLRTPPSHLACHHDAKIPSKMTTRTKMETHRLPLEWPAVAVPPAATQLLPW
jgi:hypothetical protein